MKTCQDHPDIAAALCTGYPAGARGENEDTQEARREFAEEHIKDFIDFAIDGDSDILENFVAHFGWLYKSWLN